MGLPIADPPAFAADRKIDGRHRDRMAVVYVRQSTVHQVQHNRESTQLQYGLVDRAIGLGWPRERVLVIDDDLGRSGSGGVSRPGFERLLAAICEGRVGAVFAVEASRLARNGRDWHTLIEFCGLVGTLIVDEDGAYSAQDPNDRLLLGMKGAMSLPPISLVRAIGWGTEYLPSPRKQDNNPVLLRPVTERTSGPRHAGVF